MTTTREITVHDRDSISRARRPGVRGGETVLRGRTGHPSRGARSKASRPGPRADTAAERLQREVHESVITAPGNHSRVNIMTSMTLLREGNPLADPANQLSVLQASQSVAGGRRHKPFEDSLADAGLYPLRATELEVLQVNVGKLCNMTCAHCHVDAGPDRREIMTRETARACMDVLAATEIPTLDITGGAPEMNSSFRWMVEQSHRLDRRVIDRCNLTILDVTGCADLPEFLAAHRVEIVASLPCYLEESVDAQRGTHAFKRSIEILRRLNALGYGKAETGLELTLVYNPIGPALPPSQALLEEDYRRQLLARYGVEFTRLIAITNMPIGRFLNRLLKSGQYRPVYGDVDWRLQSRRRGGRHVSDDAFRRLGRTALRLRLQSDAWRNRPAWPSTEHSRLRLRRRVPVGLSSPASTATDARPEPGRDAVERSVGEQGNGPGRSHALSARVTDASGSRTSRCDSVPSARVHARRPRDTSSNRCMMQQRLVIFTRFPEPHKAKTRLIPALEPDGAARLQADMTRHTLAWARELAEGFPVSLEVRFEGGDTGKMAMAFGDGFTYRAQGSGDLGCRMDRAFAEAFVEAIERTVVIGTDCPEITPELIRESFERLATCDLVLGPAADGGYYLLGLRRPAPQLFRDIPWGSERVLEETLRRANELSVDVSLLKTLSDVDRPEDLAVWHRVQCSCHAATAGRISVIVPTLNEAEHLPQTLLSLKGAENAETIVVDGGSTDGTAEIAERAGCRLLCSPPGRALQMNAGARAASGSILLFVHADTRLPERFDEGVRRAFDQPRLVAGAFRLRIDGPGRPLRLIEWGVNLRSRLLQMPYGDQTLFLKAETFRTIGGFPELPIMDDFELVRCLRRLGRITILSSPATTSPRRWQSLGPWRTMWINQKVIAGYYLGVPPDRLAQWYRIDRNGFSS